MPPPKKEKDFTPKMVKTDAGPMQVPTEATAARCRYAEKCRGMLNTGFCRFYHPESEYNELRKQWKVNNTLARTDFDKKNKEGQQKGRGKVRRR